MTHPHNDNPTATGRNIAARRKTLGISQTALAAAMAEQGIRHWRQNTVSRVERGQQELTIREANTLSRILGSSTLPGRTKAEQTPVGLAHLTLQRKLHNHLNTVEKEIQKATTEIQQIRRTLNKLNTTRGDQPPTPA